MAKPSLPLNFIQVVITTRLKMHLLCQTSSCYKFKFEAWGNHDLCHLMGFQCFAFQIH
jgi:hypothetical protein